MEYRSAEDRKPDRLQTWLAMIADVNNQMVSDAAEKDDDLKKIRTEAHNMAQDKEVQNMLIQEKYERMDWQSYGDEREAGGKVKGENRLASLMQQLFNSGRMDDARKAASDPTFRNHLFKEFNIV